MVSIGGFVIHGDAGKTLRPALLSLNAFCDEVITVDSESSDGSAEVVDGLGLRRLTRPWQGYGAARAAAVEALRGHDYTFFLDSDEWITADNLDRLRLLKRRGLEGPYYAVRRRDWADLDGKRFIYRRERQVRLVRYDKATYQAAKIVHESLGAKNPAATSVIIDHHYVDDIEALRAKEDLYAFLWAVMAQAAGRRPRSPWGRQLAHTLRDALIHGALFRGALRGYRLSTATARYHAAKYRYQQAMADGACAEFIQRYREGNFSWIFAHKEAGLRAAQKALNSAAGR